MNETQDALQVLRVLKDAMDRHASVSIAAASGEIVYVNSLFCKVSKYSREELIGKNHRLLKSGVHDAGFYSEMWQTITAGKTWHGEVCNRNKDGELFWGKNTIVPVLDANGAPRQYISIRTEITRNKQIEAELAKTSAELEMSVRQRTAELEEAKAALQKSNDELSVYITVLQMAQDELVKSDAVKKQEMDALAAANVRMVLFHSTMEELRKFSDGEVNVGEEFGYKVLRDAMELTGAKYGALGLFDRQGKLEKFMTEGITEAERQKIGPYPSGKGLLQGLYKEGKITRVSNIADDPRSCGFPPGHPPMRSLLGIPLVANGATKGVMYLADKQDGEPFTESDEMFVDMLAAEVQHMLARSELLEGLHESKRALEADIVARRKAEQALDQFKVTLDQTHDSVFMFSPDSLKFIYVNRGAVEQVGYAIGELLQMTPVDIKPAFTEESFRSLIQPLIAGPQDVLTFETIHRHKDGHQIPVEILLQYIHPSGAEARFVAIVRDITERKRVEGELKRRYEEVSELNSHLQSTRNQLLQSEKMASIGQLAAGVAHEINNPIGFVYSNLGALEKYVRDLCAMLDHYEQAESAISDKEVVSRLQAERKRLDIAYMKDDLHSLMQESRDGITRVKAIVQNLKDFSHADAGDEWQMADLRAGLNSTLNIVNNEIKYKAEVRKEYGEIPDIECLPSQLNQVFMNLLVNASHAIEERGLITVRTGQQGDEVWVEVEDTGKGIAPENLPKIFDPFFTTKPIGKGTGLGLSLSYGIVQKHNGRIEVQSTEGKGTAFRVWLPLRQPLKE